MLYRLVKTEFTAKYLNVIHNFNMTFNGSKFTTLAIFKDLNALTKTISLLNIRYSTKSS